MRSSCVFDERAARVSGRCFYRCYAVCGWVGWQEAWGPGLSVEIIRCQTIRGGGSSDRMTHDGANLQFDLVLGLWFGSVFYFGYIFGVDLWSTWLMGGQRQHCVCARKAYLIYIG